MVTDRVFRLWVVLVLVFAAGAAAAVDEQRLELSAFHVYRGESHAHTVYTFSHGSHRNPDKTLKADWDQENYSNYQGPPEKYFELAKAKGFDFFVVTDHSQEEPLQPVNAQRNEAWLATQAAAQKYTDETFVAIAGFEFSRNAQFDGEKTGTGHMNAINVSEYVNAKDVGIPNFYQWLKEAQPARGQGCVVASFNHPGQKGYQDWAYLDPEIAEVVTMFELRTVYRGQPRWDAYVRALNKGWKVSPTSVTDSHGYWHLDNIPPLTCVLATELTKDALTRAMQQRRTYTSWAGEKKTHVELKYSANGYVMGSTLDKPTRLAFHVEIKTPPDDPGQRVRRIQVLRNHPTDVDKVQVAAESLFDGRQSEIVWDQVVRDGSSRYFLLRIHHANDMTNGAFNEHGSTYSAPVWTGR